MIESLTIITTTVAIIVAIITYGQWSTNRDQLKFNLFEKRYAVYEIIATYIVNVIQHGRVESGSEIVFKKNTREIYFLFGGDTVLKELVSQIYRKSNELYEYQAEEKNLVGDELKKNIEKQREVKNWFADTYNTLEEKFKKYLLLKH